MWCDRLKAAQAKADNARNASKALEDKNRKRERDTIETKNEKASVSKVVAGSSFAENRGRMSCPVSSGTVIERFGKQPHPVFKNIIIENNGVPNRSTAGSRAEMCFPRCCAQHSCNWWCKTILVKHGDYFTSMVIWRMY